MLPLTAAALEVQGSVEDAGSIPVVWPGEGEKKAPKLEPCSRVKQVAQRIEH